MANLNDLSKFLKKGDLKKGDILTFADGGSIEEVDFSKAKDGSGVKTVFQITVTLPNGKDKILTINKTSQGIISEKFGVETENWIGEEVEVDYIQQLCFGKLTDVLVLKPITEAK